MVFVKAGPAEILRSSQKDEFIIKKIQNLCQDVFLKVSGPRALIKYKSFTENIGQLLYYGNTTIQGLQTLGEEYTGILQVNGSFDSIPPVITRLVMILLDIFGAHLAELFLSEVARIIKEKKDIQPEAKSQFLRWISLVKMLLPSLEMLHKAIFYCNWGTYHISKRITDIHYVLVRYWLRDRKSLFGFRILGVITIVNVFLFSIKSARNFWKSSNDLEPSSCLESVTAYGPVSLRNCSMCLSALKNPTSTTCGHVYCWACITEWTQTQDKCPVCRESVLLSRLIPLHNYI